MQNRTPRKDTPKGLKTASFLFISAICASLTSCQQESAQQSVAVAPVAPQVDLLAASLKELATLNTAEDVAPDYRSERRLGRLKSRDTLIDALDRVGADRLDANGVVHAAAEFIDMRRLRPGETFAAFFDLENPPPTAADDPDNGKLRLTGVSFQPDPMRQVLVSRTSNGDWVGRELAVKTTTGHARVGGPISSSIYSSARRQGAGDQQVIDFAEIFAYDVDFQREIRPGDEFEITYEASYDERGDKVANGAVIYAKLDGALVKREFYRFTTTDDGVTDYYNADGEAARKFLMKTPINGARLSSSFGFRKHPVLGYNKLHKGTDFAAPRGTPIYAAGNGVIERASRYGSYGHYIRIRHANGYKTAYAHLNGYARGIKSGKRVKQGQVIGYVGTTGRSTGPHLHYEVMINGKHVNAMKLKLPTGRKLNGEMLEKFQAEKERIDAIRNKNALPPQEHAVTETRRKPA